MKTINIKFGFKFNFEDQLWMVEHFVYIAKNKNGDRVRYYKCSEVTEGKSDVRNFQKDDILNGLISYK